MRLGINLGFLHRRRHPADLVRLIQAAEELGYAIAWVAEANSSDAPTILAYLAGRTSRIRLGSAVMQIPARTAEATAATATELDRITGGRFELGLGISGPQVSEGWHGVRFAQPLRRIRAYVEQVRELLPSPVPIHLGSLGPRSLELAGEIADGWQALFPSPSYL